MISRTRPPAAGERRHQVTAVLVFVDVERFLQQTTVHPRGFEKRLSACWRRDFLVAEAREVLEVRDVALLQEIVLQHGQQGRGKRQSDPKVHAVLRRPSNTRRRGM